MRQHLLALLCAHRDEFSRCEGGQPLLSTFRRSEIRQGAAMSKALSLVTAVSVALCACGTQMAARSLQSSWLGKPADAFFVRNGAPKEDHKLDAGGSVYTWESTSTEAGRMFCTVNIVTNSNGVITKIRPKEDSVGFWRLSHCAEIFH